MAQNLIPKPEKQSPTRSVSQIVALVHGAPGKGVNWERVVEFLGDTPGWYIDAADRFGYGSSFSLSNAVGLLEQRDCLLKRLTEGRSSSRLILVGHSYGAALALSLCDLAKERSDCEIVGMVLVAGVIHPLIRHDRWYHRFLRIPVLSRLLPSRYRRAAQEMGVVNSGLGNLDWEYLRSLRIPVYLIHGNRDGIVTIENTLSFQVAASADSELELTIVEGAGHNLLKSHPGLIAQRIRDLVLRLAEGRESR